MHNIEDKILSRKEFAHDGKKLEEIVIEWPWYKSPERRKLIWSFVPYDQLSVDGKDNHLYHEDFGPDQESKTEEAARESVQSLFDSLNSQ